MDNFDSWFEEATGHKPYPFQCQFADSSALGHALPTFVDIPTGCGKTAAVVLAWLWRRRFHPDLAVRQATPKRLVYCLPMRVLVEQTRDCAVKWFDKHDMLAGTPIFENGFTQYSPNPTDSRPAADGGARIAVHLLMGGEIDKDWDRYPERDAVLIGTQDQLLSRALNRGYAMSRARWPMNFGLLNNDSLWVMDEVQLMSTGLATTLQLDAFRSGENGGFGHYESCKSIWMSATLAPHWLQTVDHPKPDVAPLGLSASEKSDHNSAIGKRLNARKTLRQAQSLVDDENGVALEIIDAHEPDTLTLAIMNTVERATKLYKAIEKTAAQKAKIGNDSVEQPELVLLHSRFRPLDRQEKVSRVLSDEIPAGGRIVVSTQVVEAGVDISAKNLFTELAPWPSLVQRFGRCNRRGEHDQAVIYWIDLSEKQAPPYDWPDLQQSHEILRANEGQSMCPNNLPAVEINYEHVHVIRRKDLIELFDTTPDLAGNDLDVSRYIREGDDHDVQVFWRVWPDMDKKAPPDDLPAAHRDELCSVPMGQQLSDFIKKQTAYRWNLLDGRWEKVSFAYPGQVYLLAASSGGYTNDKGWDGKASGAVSVVERDTAAPSSYDNDSHTKSSALQTIAEHTDDVYFELKKLLTGTTTGQGEALQVAARWHDRGKSHEQFQEALLGAPADPPGIWAKGPNFRRYKRRHFRHELASALAMIQADLPDLAAYLAAAHHGKVRLSIRSLPDEKLPLDTSKRFARGVWDDDELPRVDLGGGITAPPVKLSLEPMELGLSADGKPSWAERMLNLRGDPNLGPFRLAFLETLLRVADWRASGLRAVKDIEVKALAHEVIVEAENVAQKDDEVPTNG